MSQYLFVSSISVYPGFLGARTEDSAVAKLEDETDGESGRRRPTAR